MTETTTTHDRTCAEGAAASAFTRRSLLKAVGIGTVAIAAGPMVGMRAAFAADPGWTGDTLVVLSLRGGFDGLSAIAPIGDPAYTTWRPGIAVPAAAAFQLDPMFGMHPGLAALQPFWTAGQLGFVHAAGMSAPNRSHFSAMDEMERAAPGTSARTGWLDRTVGLHAAGGPFAAVQMGSSSIPESLVGPVPVLGMDSIGRLLALGTEQQPDVAGALGHRAQRAARLGAARAAGRGVGDAVRARHGGDAQVGRATRRPTARCTRAATSATRSRTPRSSSRPTSGCACSPSTSATGTCTPASARWATAGCATSSSTSAARSRRSRRTSARSSTRPRSSRSASSVAASRRTSPAASTTAGAT